MDLGLAFKLTVMDGASAKLAQAAGRARQLAEASKAVGERWQAAGEKLGQVGEKVSKLGDQTRGAVTAILEPAMAVETAMAELGQASLASGSLTAESLAKVRAAAVAWSETHTQSATEYIQATQQMVAAGFDQEKAAAAAAVALRLQSAVGGDAAAVARTLSVVYGQLGDKTKPASEELSRLADILTRTRQLYPTIDVAGLTDPLKDASPVAKQLGVDVAQLAATLGALNGAGLQGGEAGAKLGGLMQGLSAGAGKAGIELKKTASGGLDLVATLAAIEAKFGKVETMSPQTKAALEAAFGPDTFKTMSMLLGQTDKLSAAHAKIASSAGASTDAQKAMEATMAAQAKIAENQLAALKLELAAGIAPVLQEVVPLISDGMRRFSEWVKANPGLVKILGTVLLIVAAVASVVGPIMVAGGAMLTFAGWMLATVVPALLAGAAGAATFAAALLANPITWIVLALIAAAVLIYVYWEPISKFFVDLWGRIAVAARYASTVMTQLWTAASGAVGKVFADIKAAFEVSFVKGVYTALHLLNPGAVLGRIFAAILPILARVWSDVRRGAYAAMDSMVADLTVWWQSLVDRGHDAGDALRDALAEAWDGVRADAYAAGAALVAWLDQVIVGGIRNDLAEVTQILSSFSLASAGAKIVQTIVDGMRSAADAPAAAMKGIVQQVRDYLPFSPAKVGPLRDLNRIRLVETIAEAVTPEPLVAAMSNVTGQVAGMSPTIPSVGVPAIPEAAGGGRGAVSSGPVTVTINIGAGASSSVVAELEAWIRDPANAARVAEAARQGNARRERGELG